MADTITITVSGPAKTGKSRIIESISNALQVYDLAVTKREEQSDVDLVVMAREHDGLTVEIHERRLSNWIKDGAVTASPLPGLHPANTAKMDARAREMMSNPNWPWPRRMLSLKKRDAPMATGYITEPVAEGSPLTIKSNDGISYHYSTIDHALRDGWTVD